MEDAVLVHVVHGLEQLVHEALDALLAQRLCAALDELVDVAVHELKHQRQAPRGLVVHDLVQRHDVAVRRQALERLDLAQRVHLLDALVRVPHHLDGHELPRLDGLRLDHLAEGALALAPQQLVLVHGGRRGGGGKGGGKRQREEGGRKENFKAGKGSAPPRLRRGASTEGTKK